MTQTLNLFVLFVHLFTVSGVRFNLTTNHLLDKCCILHPNAFPVIIPDSSISAATCLINQGVELGGTEQT